MKESSRFVESNVYFLFTLKASDLHQSSVGRQFHMQQQQCPKCSKTVYPKEKIETGKNWYHSGCFKCSEAGCNIQLNLKTFLLVNEALWCKQHAPKPQQTVIADSMSVVAALHAPKKDVGHSSIVVGTGEKPSVGLDSIALQSGLNAPKKGAEGLGHAQKGELGSKNSLGSKHSLGSKQSLNAN